MTMPRTADNRKKIEQYLALPYAVEVRQYEDRTWFARMPELPGCMTEADTLEEVMAQIKDAQREWIAACIADGTPVPEPRQEHSYSGQFRVRVPRSLHLELAERAKAEGTSINQMVVSLLSRSIASPAPRPSRAMRGRKVRRSSRPTTPITR
jgi:antitoxin HicB